MTLPASVTIGQCDLSLQAAFCDYVPQVFHTVDFRRWCSWDQWSDGYRAFSILDEGRVVANASVMRMRLHVQEREVTGYQPRTLRPAPPHPAIDQPAHHLRPLRFHARALVAPGGRHRRGHGGLSFHTQSEATLRVTSVSGDGTNLGAGHPE